MAASKTKVHLGIGQTQAIGYVRVSTAEQADSRGGLEAQIAAIRAASELRGWDLVIAEDAGVSGSVPWPARPALADAVRRIEAGEASALMVARIDRLSRSVLDFADLMARSRTKGWNIVALDLGVDTTTAEGELLTHVLMSFAQFERRLIAARVKSAMAAKAARGDHMGRRSTLDCHTLDRIRVAREGGQSYERIAEALNAEGIPTGQGGSQWWGATVRKIHLRSAEGQPYGRESA